MQRSTILLSTAAVLVMGAGLVLGRLSARLPEATQLPPTTRPLEHGREWLTDTLDLTPDQHQKMDAIWADVRQQMDKNFDRRRNLDKDRDTQIRALLTPAQSVAYDKIFADTRAQRADLDKEREQLYRDANERSRALLTADQQVKWDAMSKNMRDRRGPGGPPGRNRGGPSTAPSMGSAMFGEQQVLLNEYFNLVAVRYRSAA
jgi:Spy/CpxP family protein refolding chaperone